MPDTTGSLKRHAAAAACLVMLSAGAAAGQTAPPPAPAPDAPTFMSRYDVDLAAAALSIDDQRFSWDTHFGGNIDVVDYVSGRVNVLADYEAMLGSEYRPFDPNQGNYTLEGSASGRVGSVEIAGVFHHLSRHLSDRPKRFAVAYNAVGARVLDRVDVRGTLIDVRATVAKVIQHSYLDYGWTADLDLKALRPVNTAVAVYGRGTGRLYGIDQNVSQRDRQQGGRIEAGVRLQGRAGAVELFAGFEQRVDAYQIDLVPLRWGFAGFRFVK
ncbi:MAG: hypothetical protein ACM3SQ_12320 [Betaproteobacteria bacterium]